MMKWTTTTWIYRTFGHTVQSERSKPNTRWSAGIETRCYYNPNYDALQQALNEISDHCNRAQMTVKAVLPLTSAQTFEYGQSLEYSSLMNGITSAAGIGQGWGFSNVVGFAALLERVEEISDEEYERRCSDNVAPSIMPPALPVEAA